MGRKCEVAFCSSALGRSKSKSFYGFPRDSEVCSKWVKFCSNEELEKAFQDGGVEAIRCRKICADHFGESDFVNPRKTSQGIRAFALPGADDMILRCTFSPGQREAQEVGFTLPPNEIETFMHEELSIEGGRSPERDGTDQADNTVWNSHEFETDDVVLQYTLPSGERGAQDVSYIYEHTLPHDEIETCFVEELSIESGCSLESVGDYQAVETVWNPQVGKRARLEIHNRNHKALPSEGGFGSADVGDYQAIETLVETKHEPNFDHATNDQGLHAHGSALLDGFLSDEVQNQSYEQPYESGLCPESVYDFQADDKICSEIKHDNLAGCQEKLITVDDNDLMNENQSLKTRLEQTLQENKIIKSKLKKEKRKSNWRYKSMKAKDKTISSLRSKLRINKKEKTCDSKLARLVRRNPVVYNSLKNSSKKTNGRRYNASMRKFACGTYMAGPAAYRYIRKSKTLALPSKRTIGRWNADVRAQPGINLDLLDKAAGKTKYFSKKELAVLVAVDGMKIKTELSYNAKTDTFEGFPSDGKQRKFEKNKPLKLATEAIAVVVSSLSSLDSSRWEHEETSKRFKIPIGYLLAHNTMGSQAQMSMLEDVVEQLECRGFFPLVVTVDQCQTNMKMAREAGVTKKNPVIRVNDTQMVLMFDPPHLLKSMRNNLMKHNLVFQNKICSFEVIKQLYEIDQASTPRLVPKLNEQCVNLPPFGAMSVPRTVATISSTSASGIEFYEQTGDLPTDALATADLLRFHDTLFDVMNSKGLNSSKPYRRAIEKDSCHWRFLKNAEIKLKEMYYTTNTCNSITEAMDESKKLTIIQRKPNYIQGFFNNILAIRWLWTRLEAEFEFDHFCTNHVSSDTVENFNSEVRRKCGRNEAPNAYQYASAFKYSAISATQKLAEGSNCEQDNALPLLGDADISNNLKHTEPLINYEYDYEPLDESYERGYTLKELNGLMYIVGYAALKIPHKRCRKYLCIQNSSEAHYEELHKFCKLKQASIYPNSKLYEIGLYAFNTYKQKFNRFLYQNRRNVKARLKEYLSFEKYERYTCETCFEMIIDKIFNILIKSFLKEIKIALKKKSAAQRGITATKRNRKAIKMDLP